MFIRDTLSYLTLLGLHIALCLETSSIPFSSLEWAILVFFLGRILMESRQFLDVKIQRESQSATRILGGSKYQICSETEEEKRISSTKAATLLKRCNKYLRYQDTPCVFRLNIIIKIIIIIIITNLYLSIRTISNNYNIKLYRIVYKLKT